MIRHARPTDRPAIRELLETAFGGAGEAELVERLRADGDVVFELVADDAGAIVGHILYSRLWADSVHLYAALAPLAVQPERQRSGLGGELVQASLQTAREFGVHAVLVLGHPDYYLRFGFSAAAAGKISAAYSEDPAFMALAIEDGALEAPVTVAYPDAFAR